MNQLDAGAGYRSKIEADLAKRLGEREAADTKPRAQAKTCAACQTTNDADAKFCKGCGQKL
jgi:rRNA maturation endonuclease Nob1